jgi:hypothetical protein
MEKQFGFGERAIEANEPKETGFENMRLASASVKNAGTEMKKGFEALGSKNVSPESKKAIRSKIDSMKRTLTRLGALVALTLPVGMLGNMAYTEGSRHEETATETNPEESSESEAPSLGRSLSRSQGVLDPEAQLAQNMLFDLATLLREHELGIERISKGELARLIGETAVENALQELGEFANGHRLAERIRREIEDSCSEPECDTDEARAAAGLVLERLVDPANELTEPDKNFELLSASNELRDVWPDDLSLAQRANRPDLVEKGLQRRIDRASDDEDAMLSVYGAIQHMDVRLSPFDRALAINKMSPEMKAQIQRAYAYEEQRLRNERARVMAALEAANREAERTRAALEADPFAVIQGNVRTPIEGDPYATSTPSETALENLNFDLRQIDRTLSRLNQERNEIS